MAYRYKVIKHFGFIDIGVNAGYKTQNQISIAGKVQKNTLIFYIVYVLFFILFSFSAISPVTFTSVFITIILPIIMVLVILIKNKILFNKLEPKAKNINIYQRELPSKLKPAHVRMLLTDGLIDNFSFASTILDLVDKGYIELAKNNIKSGIFEKKEIILTKTDKNQEELLKYEKFLITWLFDICGDRRNVSNLEMKKILASNQSSKLFEHFQALVMISFPINKYYYKNKYNKITHLIYIITIIASFILTTSGIGALLCAWSLGNLMFNSPRYKLNQIGVNEKDNWLDFKRFLSDFSNIQDKTTEMIVNWEYYLTYSIALNMESYANEEIQNFFVTEIYNNYGAPIKEEIYKSNKQISIDNIEKDIYQELEKYERIMK